MKKIGLPRGLLFYRFYFLWKTFLEELGFEVVVSPPTNKEVVHWGLTNSVDEICFPVKVFLGHVFSLIDKVDFLFLPRMVSFHKNEYNCPKILGLPDIVRNLFRYPDENLLDSEVNMRDRGVRGWIQGYLEIGRKLGKSERETMRALSLAEEKHRDFREKVRSGLLPEVLIDGKKPFPAFPEKILLLGHPYLVSDSYINMNVVQKLADLGFSVFVSEMLPEREIRRALKLVPKVSFWTISNEILGTALHFIRDGKKEVQGLIHLVSFECGPDSLVGEVIERSLKRERKGLPYLRLEIDEHTGEAGVVTRLEAFVDMIKWRRREFESNFSSSSAP